MAANALNQKIDANPNLKYAKDVTSGGLYAAGSMVKSGFGTLGGWFGYKPAQKPDSDPLQEESKEESDYLNIDADKQAKTSETTCDPQDKEGEQVDDDGFVEPK